MMWPQHDIFVSPISFKKSASKSNDDFQIPKILPVWVFVPLKCQQNLIAIKP